MKKHTLFVLALLCFVTLQAQDFEFGEVSKAELEEAKHPTDPEASAAILYERNYITMRYIQGEGFQIETNIHKRIKIYNKDGFDWANHSVPLYKSSGGNREKVSNLKAYTYNLVGGKIEDTKLRKDGIFKEKRNEYVDIQKITMPNVKEGSVIEYRYKMISPYYGNINEVYFQYSIPVNHIEVSFEAHEYFTYKKHYKGYFRLNPKEGSRPGKISINSKSKSNFGGKTNFSRDEIDFSFKTTKYELKNVPALKAENFVSNIENYRSAVKFELAQVQMPNQIPEYYAKSWDNVVKTIYKSQSFGGELEKASYFKSDIDNLIAGESDDMRKAAKIYTYVRDRIKWNGNYGKYTDKGVRKAYKEKTGNVADMNLMLTAMLRHAGISANPVILSTRSHGITLFPTLEGFNYVITAIEVENAVILLDATNYYGEPNVLPMRALNWSGRLIRRDGSWSQISLMPKQSALRATMINVTLDEEGDLTGKQRTQFTSHNALTFRENYIQADKEDYLEKLENSIEDIEISEHAVKNVTSVGKPVMESYAFEKESQAEIIGDKMYFSPLFFLATDENMFKAEERVYPVDFGYPWKRKIMLNIKLPEGYEVESLPDASAVKMPEGLGEYSFNISKTPTGISVVMSKEIKSSVITPDKYGALREFYKMLVEKEKEKVVLKKI
ncbi:transglutaminase-like superfamily protein [Kordia sp. SMS9]|uniref:transglutaminase domain-containing protein n=1 Tax=Kordia sp. SMS9 TaxID=2282170 RepID=UPI000E0D11B4|nr:transglutaminase domain-containing protein [Kordia sp. SMS9]AXG68052.1 transglutaminase-like superfamily protein [Kordia sp. SMS9]